MMRALAWATLLLVLAGCKPAPLYQQQSYVFGTLVEVTIYGETEPRARAAAAQVLREFDRLHRAFHAWQDSPVTRLNAAFARGEAQAISDELAAAIRDAQALEAQSGGLFSPAIGKLVRLWGFQSDEFEPVRPDPRELARLLAARPRMADIRIEDGRAASANPAVALDFGGYAKGLALDRARTILAREGIENALVNIGGNILALGRHGDRPWRVGIQHPRRPGVLAELDLESGEAIGTSGDYQRYFELDGRRYCHIIDPRSGAPAQGVQAVTVLVPPGPRAGVMSDVASKPVFIAGPAAFPASARRMGVDSALLVDATGKIYVTRSFAARLHFSDGKTRPVIVP